VDREFEASIGCIVKPYFRKQKRERERERALKTLIPEGSHPLPQEEGMLNRESPIAINTFMEHISV
jgi:hypothetical protein